MKRIIIKNFKPVEPIDIKNLKPGDKLLAYNPIKLRWVKCRVNLVGNYTAVIEYIEGTLKDFKWTETFEALKDPDCYRSI